MTVQIESVSIEELAEKIAHYLEPKIGHAVQKTSDKNQEKDFFKSLTEEIMEKISRIYREVNSISQRSGGNGARHDQEQVEQASEMMTDVSQKLNQIISQTEKATFDVMDRVEISLNDKDRLEEIIKTQDMDDSAKVEMQELTCNLGNNLMEIITAMSFQDLTGQRIKRVIDTLQKVEEMTADLYVTTGMILKANENSPHESLEKTKQKIADSKVNQQDVDSFFAQLKEG